MKKLLTFLIVLLIGIQSGQVYAEPLKDEACVQSLTNFADTKAVIAEIEKEIPKFQNTTVVSEFDTRPNMISRFIVSDCNVNVAVFDCNGMNYNEGQFYVDAEDAACMRTYGVQNFIGDHNYQGFDGLYNAKVGETTAQIVTRNAIDTYLCTESALGKNITSDLLDKNGASLIQRTTPEFVTYTCMDSEGVNIWYCVWTKN